jgi:aspartate carbamoyltransferase catalytic subunit
VAAKPSLRHVNSINDLQNAEIEAVFTLADKYLNELADPGSPHKVGRSIDVARGRVLATVFLEPSTRTRLSFESAMHRLGGGVITSADPATASTAKGESLADTVKIVSNYSDVIVLRHPRDGAARHAADYAQVPVINGGDGAHEHPTQTLCDLFTLKREHRRLKGLNVAVQGDLKGSRTIHSFVYALARFKANLMLMPAKGMELPAHVDARLREEFELKVAPKSAYADDASIDALYVTADEPHQLSLIPAIDAEAAGVDANRVDVIYVTRFQKERWTGEAKDYPKVDAKFLEAPKYRKSSVLHPLPRVGELDVAFDDDARAAYFKQASYGVPVRMALIALVLGIDGAPLGRFAGGFREAVEPLYDNPHGEGLGCPNPNCICHDPLERQHTRQRFRHVGGKLRCYYCDSDTTDFVLVDRKAGKQVAADARVAGTRNIVPFADAAAAEAAGYSPAEPSKRQPNAARQ